MFEGRRGRQKIKYLDVIVEDLEGGMIENQLMHLAGDREVSRRVVANHL